MGEEQEADLKRLFDERWEEKRQEIRRKLENECQLITAKRKVSGEVGGFPEGSFERLGKNQVWEQVCGYITDPSDISSAFHTCPTFRKNLEEKRVLAFMPGVLKVLNEMDKKQNLKRRLETLNYLCLRNTSESVKKLADREFFDASFLDDSWYLNLNEERDWKVCFNDFRADVISFETIEDVDYALSSLGQNESSFIRKLYVDGSKIPFGEEYNAFHDAISKFLSIHGNSVWLFVFHGKSDVMPNAIDYQMLRGFLGLMPNLKALSLRSVTTPRYNLQDRLEAMFLQQVVLTYSPFPAIDSLEWFDCEEENEILLAQIYANCQNLKSVTCCPTQNVTERMAISLRGLRLERYLEQDNTALVNYRCPTLIFSNSATWPLKKLVISVHNAVANCSDIWPSLNRFHETLEHLEIGSVIIKDDGNVQLLLPKLKYVSLFEVDLNDDTIGVDDLIHLKALEKLVIMNYYDYGNSRRDNVLAMIKVDGFKYKMEQSNIWECFPNLKEFFYNYDCENGNRRGNRLTFVRSGSTLTKNDLAVNGRVMKKTVCAIPALLREPERNSTRLTNIRHFWDSLVALFFMVATCEG